MGGAMPRGKHMKGEIEVEVRTTSQLSFVPFTAVPDSWKGRKVKVVLIGEEPAFELASEDLPWRANE
jgi:hypothetical protein